MRIWIFGNSNFSKKIFYKFQDFRKKFLDCVWSNIVGSLVTRPGGGSLDQLTLRAFGCSARWASPPQSLPPREIGRKTQTHLHIISYPARSTQNLHSVKILGAWGWCVFMSQIKCQLIVDRVKQKNFCFGFGESHQEEIFVVSGKLTKRDFWFSEIPNPSKKYFIRPRLSEMDFVDMLTFSSDWAGPPRGESTIICHEDDHVMQKIFCFSFGVSLWEEILWRDESRQKVDLRFLIFRNSTKWELRFLEIPNPSKKYFIRPRLSEKSFGMSWVNLSHARRNDKITPHPVNQIPRKSLDKTLGARGYQKKYE